jgi:hypothetical protein
MPRLVEEAGKALYSGWLSQVYAQSGLTRGLRWVGRRRVRWFLAPTALVVLHRPADATRDPFPYPVAIDRTPMPCGGWRWWWLCPACSRRAEALYLPRDRDRLACRTCCRLTYRSQHTRRKLRRRRRRPLVVGGVVFRRWVSLAPWRRQ